MALVTGQPIPEHLPYTRIATNVANIPNYLGVIEANPTAAATYTLPPLGPNPPILSGASLIIKNISKFAITLMPANGNTLAGAASMVINPAYTAQLVSSDVTNWTFASNPPSVANVMDYGAKGDGITDDTAAIQTACDAIRVNGKSLYFPAGTYLVSTINMSSANWSAQIYGDGRKSILKRKAGIAPGATNLLTVNGCNGFLVDEINFVNDPNIVGPGSNTVDNCITLSGCNYATVKNCYFSIGYQSGIIFNSCIECTASDNYVYAMTGSPSAPDLPNVSRPSIGLLDNCVRCIVTGNHLEVNSSGILLQAVTSGAILTDCVVSGNTIIECASYGIICYDNNLNNGGVGYVKRITITGNTIRNVYGSSLNGATNSKDFGAGIYLQGANDSTVTGNAIDNTNIQTDGFTLTPGAIGAANMRSFTCTGNVITNPNVYGISYGSGNGFGTVGNGSCVTGNSITCNANTQAAVNIIDQDDVMLSQNEIAQVPTFGIVLNKATLGCNRIVIQGNRLYTSSVAISGAISASFVTQLSISNNMLYNTSNGGTCINLASCSGIQIAGNTLNRWSIGIRVQGSNAPGFIFGNLVQTANASIILDRACWTANNYGVPSGTNEYYSGIGAPVRNETVSANVVSVLGGTIISVDGTAAPTINSLSNGSPGQTVTIYNSAAGAGNITFTYNASTLRLAGSVNLVLTPKSSVTLACSGVAAPVLWQEISRTIA